MKTFAFSAGLAALMTVACSLAAPSADGRAAGVRDESDVLLAGNAGTDQDRHDCLWVLERAVGKDGAPSRHLALYRIVRSGNGYELKLEDARQIDWDLRIAQLSQAQPTVREVKKQAEEAEPKERQPVKPK
ncbi:MAG: hypothetical protein HYY16_14725 [Planctomycetes bacterium]|nr:hypothetical protein [Planctomycetota bacterium]